MAYRIVKGSDRTFTAEVEVMTPNDKCGHDLSKFTAIFRKVETSGIEALRKKSQVEVADVVLAGWKDDLQDELGVPIEFNDENRKALLAIPEAVFGIAVAYWGSVIKAKEKN